MEFTKAEITRIEKKHGKTNQLDGEPILEGRYTDKNGNDRMIYRDSGSGQRRDIPIKAEE